MEWRSPEGGDAIRSYIVFGWKDSAVLKPKKAIHVSGRDKYSCKITNLAAATTYNVMVRAGNEAGWGKNTSILTVTTGTITFDENFYFALCLFLTKHLETSFCWKQGQQVKSFKVKSL